MRRLTNSSTGRLGTELANSLAAHGHSATLLLGDQATYREVCHAQRVEPFTTTTDLEERLRALANRNVDAVFHAAAVSDFRFGKIWLRSEKGELSEVRSHKLSTRQGPLLAELVPTSKIIGSLRGWFPSARLVGWKFEVDGDRSGVIDLARNQISECRTHACVANGPAYGPGFGLVTTGNEVLHCKDMVALFEALMEFVQAADDAP